MKVYIKQYQTILLFIGIMLTSIIQAQSILAPWTITLSSTGEEVTMYFGEYGDVPVPGDYDGDGISDLAVWRRYRDTSFKGPMSKWIIQNSSDDQIVEINFGNPSELFKDVPVPGDYDGDGKTDMAYFVVATNEWRIRRSSDKQIESRTFDPTPGKPGNDDFTYTWYGEWTNNSYQLAPADYDGDGRTDLGAFAPQSTRWVYKQSSDDKFIESYYGTAGDANGIYDIAVPGDYNGDGKPELAVWRPKERKWEVNRGAAKVFGSGLEIPVPGDYDGDGITDMALFRQEPTANFEYIGDINIDHWRIDWQPVIIKDKNTYRMWWCGGSPRAYQDGIWYSESSDPASGFSEPELIREGDCYVSVIKVPNDINSKFSICGKDSVYLMYTEGENMNYVLKPDGTVDRTKWSRNEYGNKVILYYSCDARTWVKYGAVISPPSPVIGNAYGTGQPKVRYINNKILLTYYDQQDASVSGQSMLAISTDGINFTKKGQVGYSVGGRMSYMEELNTFVGVSTAHGATLSGHIQSKTSYERIFFTKDIAGMDRWLLNRQYAHLQDSLTIPKEDLPDIGVNLFDNDGFEASAFGEYPKSLITNAANGSVILDTNISRGGEWASLKFTSTGSPSFTNPYANDIEATYDTGAAGNTYQFSAWMKTAGEDIKMKAYIFCLDKNLNTNWGAGGPGANGVFSFKSGVANSDWSKITHSHTCPVGSEYVSVRLDNDAYTTSPQPADPTIWFDDVRLIKTPMQEDQVCTQGPDFLTNAQGIIEGKQTYVYSGHWNQKDNCHTNALGFSIKNSDMYVMKVNFNYKNQTGCAGGMFRKCTIGNCEAIQRRNCNGNDWGNWEACNISDKQDPVITGCPDDTVFYLKPDECGTRYSWEMPLVSDNCAASISGSISPGSFFEPGTIKITYIANDSAGNQSVCSFNVTVRDTTSPTINCPNDTMIVTDDMKIIVDYPEPLAIDSCGISSLTLLSGLSSGSEFPRDTTMQIFEAIDLNGNKNTCTFKVIVNRLTKINESQELSNLFTLFPNPNKGKVFLQNNLDFNEPVQIRIFTIDGKQVFNMQWNTWEKEQIEIPVDGKNGAYLIELNTEKGVFRTEMIKQ